MGKRSFLTFLKELSVLLLLILVFLEVGLRAEGFILSFMQEHRNLQSLRQKSVYRILCLGESTTRGQYPHLLEQILNQRNIGVRFSVIDKGRDATNTLQILSRVEAELAEYHPDMVIAMMGISNQLKNMPLAALAASGKTPFPRSLITYNLARLLWLHILTQARKMGLYKPAGDTRSSEKAQAFFPETGLKETPAGSISTEDSFKRNIELNPKNDGAYVGLGRLYQNQGKFPQAEDSFRKAIELNPRNDKAYVELGRLYRDQRNFIQAEAFFRKALEINPKNEHAYDRLGWLCQDKGRFVEAEDSYKKIVGLNPKNENAYFALGVLYRAQGQFSQAEDSFRKALEIDPKNARALGAMASLCEETGKPGLAKEYAEKVNGLRSEYYVPETINSYRMLKEILDRKGIKLVCSQYPMRNAEPLKRIFRKEEGVIFVDNEGVFKEAVKKGGRKEYFKDMFAGDFGHCTQKGNMLLAQNIADVILREVFNKS